MNAPLIILATSFFVALTMAGVLYIIARTYPKSIQNLTDWSWGLLAMALGLPLLIARNPTSPTCSALFQGDTEQVGLLCGSTSLS